MDHEAVSHSEVKIRIGLNEKKWPVSIEWEAEDQPGGKRPQACKAFLLSLFDREYKETLRMDLWTKEMQVMEMDRMVFHTLRGLADTYFKATNNKEMAVAMQQFAQFFGEKTEIIPPAKKSEG